MARSAVMVAAAAVLLAALALALLWSLQRQLVYLPDRDPTLSAAVVLPGALDVVLQTEDGLELGAWYLPAGSAGAPTVLVASGNGGSCKLRAPLARALAGQGVSVLLFDCRGYGGNPGNPSEQGLARDVRAARRFLLEIARVPGDGLLYLGESLGAAVVTELATQHPPAGLVLRSPFTDLAAVGSLHYPLLPVRALTPAQPTDDGLPHAAAVTCLCLCLGRRLRRTGGAATPVRGPARSRSGRASSCGPCSPRRCRTSCS